MNSSRTIVALTAVAAFLALAVGVLSMTTRRAPAPPCPQCQSHNTRLFQDNAGPGFYKCEDCNWGFTGPAQSAFSWADAAEEWLRD